MSNTWFAAYLVLSAVLFGIGTFGFLLRRNLIVLLMCIELMLNGVNLALVTFSRFLGSVDAQVVAALVIVVAASEAAVGLALLIQVYTRFRSLDVESLRDLGDPPGPMADDREAPDDAVSPDGIEQRS